MLNLNFIGRVSTEFPEKFGVPKQPQLAPSLKGVLHFCAPYNDPNYLKGLERCSHIWVLFYFHLNKAHSGTTIRPPVLGGTQRMGIFSTRSPHRPNPIGLSLLKVDSIDMNLCEVHVSGHDLVHDTPFFDIKPYVASYDSPREMSQHWSDDVDQVPLEVLWSEEAQLDLKNLKIEIHKTAIDEILRLDPRPRSKDQAASFGFYFKEFNVLFRGDARELIVMRIIKTN